MGLSLAVIVTPLLITLALQHGYLGTSLATHLPVWSDETFYWKQIETFRQAGFNGGYFTYNEAPARAAFIRFGAHGPWIAALLGAISRVTGWYLASMPVINLACICGALAVLIALIRPTIRQLALLIVVLGSFWPLLLFTPTTMVESLNQALGILLAGLFWRMLSGDGGSTNNRVLFALILFASLIRPLWSLLWLPWLLLIPAPGTGVGRWLRFSGVILLIGLMFGLWVYWSAPYPSSFIADFTKSIGQAKLGGLGVLFRHVVLNSALLLQGNPLHLLLRAQIGLFVMVSWISLLPASSSLAGRLRVARGPTQREALFHLLNLGSVLAVIMLWYDVFDWRDYRSLAPHLLLSLLIIARRMPRFASLIALSSLVFVSAFLTTYQEFAKEREYISQPDIANFRDAVEPFIRFDPAAPNGWCNTVLVSALPPEVIGLPPGMGISLSFDAQQTVFRSRYLLLDKSTITILGDRPDLELLTQVGGASLFRNRVVVCG
jgi:hypothetical protein